MKSFRGTIYKFSIFLMAAIPALQIALGQTVTTISNMGLTNAQGFGVHTYLVASLMADNASDGDHLHLLATMNYGDGSSSNSTVDILFGNRSGFNAVYNAKGASPTGLPVHIVAYRQSDSSTNIYMILPDFWDNITYSVVENMQDTVYSSPSDIGSATPPGTLVFDTASASYPPNNYSGFSGVTGVNTASPTAQLEVDGNIKLTNGSGASMTFADGSVQSTAWTGSLCGGDYAESVNITGERSQYEPGDVLVISDGSSTDVSKSKEAYSRLVGGIYSTKPGLVGRRQSGAKTDQEIPMAMVGIVPTKVTAENGAIKRGDLLVTSSKSGYAMKGTDSSRMVGAVIGKALGALDSGTGVIEVLVSLQ